jgi:hypothetical protein
MAQIRRRLRASVLPSLSAWTGGMGFGGRFAEQQILMAVVRHGSVATELHMTAHHPIADIRACFVFSHR